MAAPQAIFWASAALIVYAHVGYPLALAALVATARRKRRDAPATAEPRVSLICAAHDEEAVIERLVATSLALDYPRERLELIVACDGCEDRTAALARAGGADLVLELPRAGKVAAINAAVERASGEVLAFADANAVWEKGALSELVAALADPGVGYACGMLVLEGDDGGNQEGVYWRYEMSVRRLESALAGITAGNGAINAVRAGAWIELVPTSGHDLALPPALAKRGLRSVYRPAARARERMAPTIGAELRRKRRMMARTWGILLGSALLSPRGYRPLYAFEIYSHRLLRYLTPLLHLLALAANAALLGAGPLYTLTFAAQIALLAAGAAAGVAPWWPLRLARYYLAVTASSALGLWDYLRSGAPSAWESVR